MYAAIAVYVLENLYLTILIFITNLIKLYKINLFFSTFYFVSSKTKSFFFNLILISSTVW